jgi:hypothetical protein
VVTAKHNAPLSTKDFDLLSAWLKTEETLCFKLPLSFVWRSGEPTAKSLNYCLRQVIEPIFREATTLTLLGSRLTPASLGGEGATVELESKPEGRNRSTISYQRGLVRRLPRFFRNEANSSVGLDLRGTVVMTLSLRSFLSLGITTALERPHFVRNFRVAYKPSTLHWLKRQVADRPHLLHVALPDRTELSSVSLFGRAPALAAILRVWQDHAARA